MSTLFKNKFSSKNLGLFVLTTYLSFIPHVVNASTIPQINGQLGLVGEFLSDVAPRNSRYEATHVPFGLTLSVKPTSNLSAFLDFRIGYGNYPHSSRLLGNSQNDDYANTNWLPMTGFTEKKYDTYLGFAYFQYEFPAYGLLQIGRMPKHWGLGLWKNSGGLGSTDSNTKLSYLSLNNTTIDGISFTLNTSQRYVFRGVFEKYAEGNPWQTIDDAEALSFELIYNDAPIDAGNNEFTKEIGIAYSRFSDAKVFTKMNNVDLYFKIGLARFSLQGEIYYVMGQTENLSFVKMGAKCLTYTEGICKSIVTSDLSAVSFLLNFNYLIFSDYTSKQVSVDTLTKHNVSNDKLPEFLTLGLTLGYAQGDKDSYPQNNLSNINIADNKIKQGMMNSNIRPALLMFNNLGQVTDENQGMPVANIQNTLFLKSSLLYNLPLIGNFDFSLIWGGLDEINPDVNGYGQNKNLGLEIDASYSYLRNDNVEFSFKTGYWFTGKAWQKTSLSPNNSFGVQVGIGTSF